PHYLTVFFSTHPLRTQLYPLSLHDALPICRSTPKTRRRRDRRRAPCRAVRPSVELRGGEPWLFENRAEHDRGARVHLDRRRRTAQVAQQILEALEIGRGDLEDVTVLTRDVV